MMMPDEMEDVVDRLERVVDFVGDDAGDAAHGGQLLRCPERLFCAEACSDVTAYFEDSFRLAGSADFERFAASDCDGLAAASDLLQIALPPASLVQRGFDPADWDEELCGENLVEVLAEHFLAPPTVKVFRTGTPEADITGHVADVVG